MKTRKARKIRARSKAQEARVSGTGGIATMTGGAAPTRASIRRPAALCTGRLDRELGMRSRATRGDDGADGNGSARDGRAGAKGDQR